VPPRLQPGRGSHDESEIADSIPHRLDVGPMGTGAIEGIEMADQIAKTPQPPYYAVIFTSLRTEGDNEYGGTADRIEELAKSQPGYLGFEAARSGLGIAVAYWRSEADIAAWKRQVEHAEAQRRGRVDWYREYRVRVAKVEREYGWEKP
jgi:heme-degrading monooxygenase HmoA